MKTLVAILSLSLFLCGIARAQDAPVDEFVLIPAYSAQLDGAFGSIWTTELVIRNENDQPLTYRPLQCLFPCAGPAEVPPHTSQHVDAVLPLPEGRTLRLSTLDRVHFSLRIRDLSRQAESAGVQVPVVHAEAMATRVVLPSVPTDERFRHTLRIYDVSGVAAPAIRLRVYPFNGDVPVVDTTIPLQIFSGNSTPAQLALGSFGAAYPAFTTMNEARFEIEALDPGMQMWAFVSITNNATQEVTIVTPQ